METVITLTTDFSSADLYIAAIKGVIPGINPQVKLIDICPLFYPWDIADGGNIQ